LGKVVLHVKCIWILRQIRQIYYGFIGSPIFHWFFYASDTVYQLLAHDRWFSPGTPASSTIKTGRHDIAEKLLKVALKHQKINKNLCHKVTYCVALVT
jgi:hypothetical protein